MALGGHPGSVGEDDVGTPAQCRAHGERHVRVRGSHWPWPQLLPHPGTPSPRRSLHMGLGQTPAKWAGGGCISKPLAGANAAAPPLGCHPSAAPDPSTAVLVGTIPSPSQGWWGPSGKGSVPGGPTLGPLQESGSLWG